MKAVNIYFEDSDFEKMNISKDKLSWREFILKLFEVYKNNEEEEVTN